MAKAQVTAEAPTIVNSSVRNTRKYLTPAEVERLMAAARKSGRYGHRDATMILIAFRHGLRAFELCDLMWSQIELSAGRLHVRRVKSGTPSVHPMQGDEIRALRRLQREEAPSSHVFTTERGGPMTPKGFNTLRSHRGARQDAVPSASAHAATRVRLCLGQCWPRHTRIAGVSRSQEHSAHGALHRACAASVQGLLALTIAGIDRCPPLYEGWTRSRRRAEGKMVC
jgi:hypothetical protein